jgi:hypothetical protein
VQRQSTVAEASEALVDAVLETTESVLSRVSDGSCVPVLVLDKNRNIVDRFSRPLRWHPP